MKSEHGATLASENGPKPLRILIVDDHPLVRFGLAQLISDEPDMEVCGEAEDVDDALQAIQDLQPDLAIVDLAFERGSGMDLLRAIRTQGLRVKSIVLSMQQESLFAERALQAGASGYLNKKTANREIVSAIRRVRSGRAYLSADMTERIQQRIAHGTLESIGKPLEALSDRELEVFRLISEGCETRHIAERLNVSARTVETHKERIKAKLGLATAGELTRRATEWAVSGYSE